MCEAGPGMQPGIERVRNRRSIICTSLFEERRERGREALDQDGLLVCSLRMPRGRGGRRWQHLFTLQSTGNFSLESVSKTVNRQVASTSFVVRNSDWRYAESFSRPQRHCCLLDNVFQHFCSFDNVDVRPFYRVASNVTVCRGADGGLALALVFGRLGHPVRRIKYETRAMGGGEQGRHCTNPFRVDAERQRPLSVRVAGADRSLKKTKRENRSKNTIRAFGAPTFIVAELGDAIGDFCEG